MAKEKEIKKDTEKKEVEKTETKKINIKKLVKKLGSKIKKSTKKLIDKTKDYIRFHKNQVVRTVTSLGIIIAVVIIAIIAKNIIVGAGIGNIGYPIIYQKSNNDVFMLEHGADAKDKEQVKKMQSTGSIEYSNTSNRYILFKNNTDLYIYDVKKNESKKIIEEVSYNYGFSTNDSYIFAQDNYGDLYAYDYEELNLLDNSISSIQAYSDTSIIYEKNGQLMFLSFDTTKEDKTSLVDAFTIADMSENGKYVLYTNSNSVLYRYDVKKQKHEKISSGVEYFYCADKSCKEFYYIKTSEKTTLEYYDGSKSIELASEVYDIVGTDLENNRILFTKINEDKLSLYYVYKTKKAKLVTDEFNFGSSVKLAEDSIYYVNDKSKLMYVKASGASVGKAKEVAKEVQGTLTEYNGGVYYYKNINDENDATYYYAVGTKTTKIADDIRKDKLTISLDNEKIFYIKDMDGTVGTLSIFDGKESKKIAENVQSTLYVKGETIYYIADYNDTTKTGTLYRYDGKKTEISKDVMYIVTTTPNVENNN